MRQPYPPRKAPTGLRAGRATVASASLEGVELKVRDAVDRRGEEAARRLRAPAEATRADILSLRYGRIRFVMVRTEYLIGELSWPECLALSFDGEALQGSSFGKRL